MGRKLTPQEKAKKDFEKLMNNRSAYKEISRKFGNEIRKKPKRNITEADKAKFECPKCGENLVMNLIRLRPGFYQCRKCNEYIIRNHMTDEEEDQELENYEI